jgi:hypothetical protein
MLRTRNVLICLPLVTLCLAGTALARAARQELVDADENQIGEANLNYAEGAHKTEIQVNGWDLASETEHVVLLCDGDGAEEAIGSFTTDEEGRGHFHARCEGCVCDGSVVLGVLGADAVFVPCGWYGVCPFRPYGPYEPPILPVAPVPIDGPIFAPGPRVVEVRFIGTYYDGDGYYIICNPNTPIMVRFDRAIDPSTVTTSTFIVTNGLERVSGTLTVGCSSTMIIFHPDAEWENKEWVNVELVGTPDPSTVSPEVMTSTIGAAIDGDADGYPGGNFSFLIETWLF